MGGKKDPQRLRKKNEAISVRMAHDEKVILEKLAESSDISTSEAARLSIRHILRDGPDIAVAILKRHSSKS